MEQNELIISIKIAPPRYTYRLERRRRRKKTQLQVTWQKLCTLMLVCISNRNRTNGLDKNEEGAWKIYIQILIYSNWKHNAKPISTNQPNNRPFGQRRRNDKSETRQIHNLCVGGKKGLEVRKIAIEKRNKTNLIKKLFPQSASILGRQRRSIAKYFSLLSRCEFPLLRFLHFTCVCTIPGRAVHIARERKRKNEIGEERKRDNWNGVR